MAPFFQRVRDFGFEKTRTAVALLPLSLFGFVYLLGAVNSPPGWTGAFVALSAVYLTAFVALGSEWFWARWFASGLGWSGTMVAIAATVMMGWNPMLAIYGGLHALTVVMLLGPKMAARYDLQAGWRQRFEMDEFGVARLRKAVTRASAALPSLILWALGPREGQGHGLLTICAAVLALVGVGALVRMRTWGLLAIGGAAVGILAGTSIVPAHQALVGWTAPLGVALSTPGSGVVLSLLLIAAALPFAGAAVRFYRSLK